MITIRKGDVILNHTRMLFPAGETGIKLDVDNLRFKHDNRPICVVARIHSGDDLMELALAKDALWEWLGETKVRLYMYYAPYARQDRACVKGEPFSLKVFATLINALSFEHVVIADPHSDVCAGVFDRMITIKQEEIVHRFQPFIERVLKGVTFVAPDAGSNKKTSALAAYFGHGDFIRADKLRNLATGKILETIVYADDLKGRDIVIADDLIDGGASFTALAQVLKRKGANKVILYTTHGIFSKGTKVLFDSGIDELFSTTSYYDVWPAGVDRVTTLKLEDHFLI